MQASTYDPLAFYYKMLYYKGELMTTPMFPHPFFNYLEKEKEGRRRYGTLENSDGKACPKCGTPIRSEPSYIGKWHLSYSCPLHGTIKSEELVDANSPAAVSAREKNAQNQ